MRAKVNNLPEHGTSTAHSPLGLFHKTMFTTITSSSNSSALSIQPGCEYRLKLGLSGKGYITIFLNELNSLNFYRIGELALCERIDRHDFLRRVKLSPTTKGISVMIEHRGSSSVKIEYATVEVIG